MNDHHVNIKYVLAILYCFACIVCIGYANIMLVNTAVAAWAISPSNILFWDVLKYPLITIISGIAFGIGVGLVCDLSKIRHQKMRMQRK